MTPQSILDNWDYQIPEEDRKEIYEVLMGMPEFGRFLQVLKDCQNGAYRSAQADMEHSEFYLGQAAGVDVIIGDIDEVLNGASERL